MGSYRKISVDVGPLLLRSISKMSMAVAKTRASPFRESEWDRRLDGMLDDLQNSTQISESRQVSYSRVQQHNHSITKSRSTCSLGTTSASAQNTSQGNVTTDNMLKDLDVALRASRNYIEKTNDEKMSSNTGDGFNLERQVEHMMPEATSNTASYSTSMHAQSLTSAHSSFITSKVQTNTYNSSSQNNEVSRSIEIQRQATPERPSSKTPSLKANIDELDNILTDLNNSIASGLNSKAQTMSPSPMPPILKIDKQSRVSPSPRPVSPAVEFKKTTSVGPGPFPTTTEYVSTEQNPPKRVDVLMTEMTQYDSTAAESTIQVLAEETETSSSNNHESIEVEDQQDCIKVLKTPSKDVTPEPEQPSSKGAPSAVYYPPGDLYSADPQQSEVGSNPSATTERKKKDRSDRKMRDDSGYGNTQGAAVVPICLPLCCAAPCVIL